MCFNQYFLRHSPIVDEHFASRVSSAVAVSRYSSAVSSARSAPEMIKSPSGYRMTSATPKKGLRIDTAAGGLINDASDDELDDPTLFIAPGSEKALVGVTR